MYSEEKLYIAHSENGPINIIGRMANRHGLIAGATGTGKTVSLQVLAETFSQAGVPCFMADMKGDLSGISQMGKMTGFIEKRCAEFGISNPQFEGCPVRFFDVFGEQGYSMRTTISAMGPMLLARLMDLNPVQSGILNVAFRIADDNGLLLIDLKDLRLLLDFIAKNASQFTTSYGNISQASVGAIQRAVLAIETEGGDKFFGEPAFDVNDLLDVQDGKGVMNVLSADKLMLQPKLYSTFLMWLLTELYTELPEVGDMDLPKLVFFFDEAHMLFDGTPKALTDKIEQIIRLIRSKGVGIYFVTQSPTDIPDDILGQLGNRIQHALRAYTPKDQKAVKAAAQTFRANPSFKTEDAIMELSTGEALVSFLDESGAPSVVQRAKVLFPLSSIGAITAGQRLDINNAAPEHIKEYNSFFDRESAYEILSAHIAEQDAAQAEAIAAKEAAKQERLQRQEAERQAKEQRQVKQQEDRMARVLREAEERRQRVLREDAARRERSAASKTSGTISRTILGTMVGAVATSFARSMGTQVAKKVATGSLKPVRETTKSVSQSRKSSTVLAKAGQSAANTAARKITNELLKGIFG